jgi:hypothetical protein
MAESLGGLVEALKWQSVGAVAPHVRRWIYNYPIGYIYPEITYWLKQEGCQSYNLRAPGNLVFQSERE